MTIKEFYESLPEASYPKKEFIDRVATECGVSTGAVRRWIHEGKKPKDEYFDKVRNISKNQITKNSNEDKIQ